MPHQLVTSARLRLKQRVTGTHSFTTRCVDCFTVGMLLPGYGPLPLALHQYTAPPVIDLFLWTESYTPRHGHLGSIGLLHITVLQTQTPPGYLGSIGLLAITGY